jgi:hypothetical protein
MAIGLIVLWLFQKAIPAFMAVKKGVFAIIWAQGDWLPDKEGQRLLKPIINGRNLRIWVIGDGFIG